MAVDSVLQAKSFALENPLCRLDTTITNQSGMGHRNE